MKFSEAFPSKYLKAEDILGHEVDVVIDAISMEEMTNDSGRTEVKPVLHFVGKEKGLVLNITNGIVIRDRFGDDMDDWKGKQITLITRKIEAFGKVQDALRVKLPEEAPATTDNIPF